MKNISSVIFWVGFYLVLVLAPLLTLMFGEVPRGSGFWWDFSMALGFTGMAMMGVQFILTARFKRASTPFGIDIIYYFHRYLALMAVTLIFLHFLIIRVYNAEALGELNPLQAPWFMTAGRISLGLFVLLIVTSLWRKPLRIHYDEWRMLHIALAMTGFLLALVHIEGVGYYIDAPSKRWLWTAYTLFWLLLIVFLRVIKPWLLHNKPYRVTEIRQEHGNSWTLSLTPDGHQGMTFQPGQFAWLTLRDSPWHIKEHPFSISSSAEKSEQLEFTIKELGDFTRTIKETLVGDIAYLDGPYGAFSVDRFPDASGYVFIAGGVGAAPIMSMLRTLADRNEQRPLWFIYGNNSWQDVIFREELETLEQRLNLRLVHVLNKPAADWEGESGVITPQLLRKILPDEKQKIEYFLCGPKPMSDMVQQELHKLQVPMSKIHFELFDMV
ncbi:MAG: oxidoreductase [Gammaproteobacteria bacterium]|nr:oxidoreductase [Gammaproteobacteria bacterium]